MEPAPNVTPASGARWPRYVAALCGLAWYLRLGGAYSLNPTRFDWILSGDWQQHWIGWRFFRLEPWSFPLGKISALPYPVGTNIGFTDSNPLIALLLKPFEPLLPAEFQFMGPWLALCFVLQGYAGAMLASTVTRNAWQQFLGGCLFVLSPVLMGRMGHDTLCAQWLLLGILYFGLKEYTNAASAAGNAWWFVGLVALASSIHPYLAAMSVVLALAGVLRLLRARLVTGRQAAVLAAAIAGTMPAIFAVIGYMGTPSGSGGWGRFSADLVTFINPNGYSRLLPSFTLPAGEWEGLGFLGMGGLIALVIAMVIAFVMHRRLRPTLRAGTGVIVVACVLLAVFALSENIRLAGEQVARMHTLYKSFPAVTGALRASGRFIWPLHYLLLLFGIWGATKIGGLSRARVGTIVLAALVVVQAADLKIETALLRPKGFHETPLADFAPAAGRFRHLALYPMLIEGVCANDYQEHLVYRLMLSAARLHLTFNSGTFARRPEDRLLMACQDLDHKVEAGELDRETIYVVSPSALPQFAAAQAACGRIDGENVCVSREADEGFRTHLGKMERVK